MPGLENESRIWKKELIENLIYCISSSVATSFIYIVFCISVISSISSTFLCHLISGFLLITPIPRHGTSNKILSKENKIVGAHIVSKEASALIQQILIAMQNDVSVEKLKEVCFAHPTYSEGIFESLFRL